MSIELLPEADGIDNLLKKQEVIPKLSGNTGFPAKTRGFDADNPDLQGFWGRFGINSLLMRNLDIGRDTEQTTDVAPQPGVCG